MKQYQFSLKDECMKELPSPESNILSKVVANPKSISNVVNHFIKLQSIPVPKEYISSFTDGKIYNEDEFYKQGIVWDITNDCELKTYGNELDWTKYEVRKVAIPKQKIDDTELWDDISDRICDILYESNGFSSGADMIINELKKHYTITRKIK